jgi:hypothetical protein
MKITTLALTGAVCLALAAAAPAAAASRDDSPQQPAGQALSPEVVPGAGLAGVAGTQITILHVVRGTGSTGAASFSVNLGRASGKVLYADPLRKITFTSLSVGSVRFADNTATLHGVGLVNHRRVAFTAVGVHNQLPGIDVFRISWNHGAGHGGRIVRGSLFIR